MLTVDDESLKRSGLIESSKVTDGVRMIHLVRSSCGNE